MTRLQIVCVLLAAGSALAQTPAANKPETVDQARALAAVRDYALNYTANLPNFMCTQVIHRTYRPNLAFTGYPRHDAIEEQITFAGRKERYTVTKINGEPVNNIARNQLGGILSSGEFGTLLGHTFDPKVGAEFRLERTAALKGQRVYVFAFRVPEMNGYALVESKRTLMVAYKGVLFADSQTGAILRVEMQCEIPNDSEFKELELALDYKTTDVAGREFILPSHYRLHSRKLVVADASSDRLTTRTAPVSETVNEADYKTYRRFDADSTVTFGNETSSKR